MKWRPSSAVACAFALVLAAPAAALARPMLLAARAAIALQPGACEVELRLDLQLPGPAAIDHRLAVGEGVTVTGLSVRGGNAVAGSARTEGRTLSLPMTFAAGGRESYALQYRAASAAGSLDRCPLFLPLAPADGLSRAVAIEVTPPAGTVLLPGEFPAFTWGSDGRGRASLGHLPAFVLVRTRAAGEQVDWVDTLDTRRAVDVAALGILGGASVMWVLVQRRRRAR